MTPDQLRALADALAKGTHFVDSPELHAAMQNAADYLLACADEKPVAWRVEIERLTAALELDTALDRERLGLDGTRPPTPVGWSDTDWIKRLQEQDEQPHPLAGQHINQGSMDAAADAYEAEYNAARGEQVRRMAVDAARYRWLRGDSCPDHSSRWTQWEVRCWKAPSWTGDLRRADLDDAIDAARGKE